MFGGHHLQIEIEKLPKDQSQKSLHQSKIPDFFAAKSSKIMKYNCLDMYSKQTLVITDLMYHCRYTNNFVLLLRKSAVAS